MRRISIWMAGALVLTAIVVTFITTTYLDLRYRNTREDKLLEAADLIEASFIGDVDRDAMTDAAIQAMVDSLGDRWSYYLTAESLSRYRNVERNRYQGLGLVLMADEAGGVVIHTVYPGSPAGKAGVLAGSRIISANGADLHTATLEETITQISAAIGSGQVTLGLLDPNGEEQEVILEPGEVETDPVAWKLLPDGLGLIRIDNFEDRSGEQTLEAIEDLCQEGAKGLIFDVRNNPGGQLQQLLKALDRILPEGELFISKNTRGKTETEYSDAECLELPMAVLVNSDSYSAAEFFAAALQEYGWALVIGEQTTGKGYAQVTLMLSDGSAVHLSTVEYFTPKGNSLAGVGLTPDLETDLDSDRRRLLAYGLLEPEEDTQLQAARNALMEKIGG